MPLILADAAGDGSQTPFLVGFFELSGGDSLSIEESAKRFKPRFVSDRQMDVGRVEVGRAAKLVGVLDGSMRCLNGLLREWDVAARDGVEVVLGEVLGFHDGLTGCRFTLMLG